MADEVDSDDYCFCGKIIGGEMIQCDGCEVWFHLECLKMDEWLSKSIHHYFCFLCHHRKKLNVTYYDKKIWSNKRFEILTEKSKKQETKLLSFLTDDIKTCDDFRLMWTKLPKYRRSSGRRRSKTSTDQSISDKAKKKIRLTDDYETNNDDEEEVEVKDENKMEIDEMIEENSEVKESQSNHDSLMSDESVDDNEDNEEETEESTDDDVEETEEETEEESEEIEEKKVECEEEIDENELSSIFYEDFIDLANSDDETKMLFNQIIELGTMEYALQYLMKINQFNDFQFFHSIPSSCSCYDDHLPSIRLTCPFCSHVTLEDNSLFTHIAQEHFLIQHFPHDKWDNKHQKFLFEQISNQFDSMNWNDIYLISFGEHVAEQTVFHIDRMLNEIYPLKELYFSKFKLSNECVQEDEEEKEIEKIPIIEIENFVKNLLDDIEKNEQEEKERELKEEEEKKLRLIKEEERRSDELKMIKEKILKELKLEKLKVKEENETKNIQEAKIPEENSEIKLKESKIVEKNDETELKESKIPQENDETKKKKSKKLQENSETKAKESKKLQENFEIKLEESKVVEKDYEKKTKVVEQSTLKNLRDFRIKRDEDENEMKKLEIYQERRESNEHSIPPEQTIKDLLEKKSNDESKSILVPSTVSTDNTSVIFPSTSSGTLMNCFQNKENKGVVPLISPNSYKLYSHQSPMNDARQKFYKKIIGNELNESEERMESKIRIPKNPLLNFRPNRSANRIEKKPSIKTSPVDDKCKVSTTSDGCSEVMTCSVDDVVKAEPYFKIRKRQWPIRRLISELDRFCEKETEPTNFFNSASYAAVKYYMTKFGEEKLHREDYSLSNQIFLNKEEKDLEVEISKEDIIRPTSLLHQIRRHHNDEIILNGKYKNHTKPFRSVVNKEFKRSNKSNKTQNSNSINSNKRTIIPQITDEYCSEYTSSSELTKSLLNKSTISTIPQLDGMDLSEERVTLVQVPMNNLFSYSVEILTNCLKSREFIDELSELEKKRKKLFRTNFVRLISSVYCSSLFKRLALFFNSQQRQMNHRDFYLNLFILNKMKMRLVHNYLEVLER
ncbi:hypothetical protein SNEBB_003211 [Seison nebaliae]|nr:hypothetical protein SNEBB_003211 [Seison nebaliae]